MTADTTARELSALAALAGRAALELELVPPAGLVRMLDAIADGLEEQRPALVALAHEETSILPERLEAELTRTTSQLRFLGVVVGDGAHLGASIDHRTATTPDLRRIGRGIGPVGVFAASNFPFAFGIAGGDVASALAAGNPVIVKAHPGHPGLSQHTASIVASALERSGAPAGTFAVVYGYEIGRELVLHPALRAAAFTGSTRGGRALFDLACSRPVPIPFYGELGSINPVVVTAAALNERGPTIARDLVASFTLGQGQLCTKPGIVLVPADDDFVGRVASAAGAVTRSAMLSEALAGAFRDSVGRLAARQGVATIVDGSSGTPWLFASSAATLISQPEGLQEECFGPSTLLVSYRDDTELMAAMTLLDGSLAAAVHTGDGDDELAGRLLGMLARTCGRVVWNGWPTGVAVGWSTQHGGPYPASTPPASTSVGASAIGRFLRPVAFQEVPDALLPAGLREGNPLGIPRRVDGEQR